MRVLRDCVYGTGRGGEGHEFDVGSNVLGLWRLERVVGDVEGSGSGALFVEGLEAGEEGQGLAGETEDASSEEEVFAEFEGGL
ncbi:hypothetical protein DID88_000229 [Monilinia fructigena]|uniref:Uncharacterized protein n=1 Tax=Monilinia fructigena TaxID=38457 RepID=A0A395IKT5_9HELO|nr:hypothetical protein DID88_000229 [Monilinia fructigena]